MNTADIKKSLIAHWDLFQGTYHQFLWEMQKKSFYIIIADL